MKTFLSALIFLLFGHFGTAQDTVTTGADYAVFNHSRIPANSIYLDLGGHLNLFSFNYERVFLQKKNFYMSARTGLGYTPPEINTISVLGLVNCFYRISGDILAEIGAGLNLTYTFWADFYSDDGMNSSSVFHESGRFIDPIITGFAGIRIQKPKGFLFRAGLTPLYEFANNPENSTCYMQLGTTNPFVPWFSISFGYSFGKK